MEESIKKFCEGCKTTFDTNVFLKHVSKSNKCKDVYGEERLNTLKKEMKAAAKRRHKKLANDIFHYVNNLMSNS